MQFLDGLCDFIDLVGDALRSGTSIGDIVLDTKIVVGTSRVVRGSQENTTSGFELANQVGSSRRGENTVLSDNQFGDLGKDKKKNLRID
jgi:hypothetical protein